MQLIPNVNLRCISKTEFEQNLLQCESKGNMVDLKNINFADLNNTKIFLPTFYNKKAFD